MLKISRKAQKILDAHENSLKQKWERLDKEKKAAAKQKKAERKEKNKIDNKIVNTKPFEITITGEIEAILQELEPGSRIVETLNLHGLKNLLRLKKISQKQFDEAVKFSSNQGS
jgi:hypothetical protein